MMLLCTFSEAMVGLIVMVGALVYLVHRPTGLRMFKAAAIVAFALFIVVPFTVHLFEQLDWATATVLVMAVSIGANFIRDRRKPHRPRPERPAGGERKPLLPRMGGGE